MYINIYFPHKRHQIIDVSFLRWRLDRLCNHKLKDSVNNLHSRKRSSLAIIVVCRCHFNDVSSNNVQALQPS